jgi:transcriptional regulator with XRE-family HTH domain
MGATSFYPPSVQCHHPVMTTEFWNRLTTAFAEAGMETSQSAIARSLELGQSAVAKWAHGVGLPTLRKSIQIAKITGVNVEWLITGRGPKKEQGGSVDETTKQLLERLAEASPEDRREILAFIEFKLANTPPAHKRTERG